MKTYTFCAKACNELLLYADGQRSGMTPESLKQAANATKQMNLDEAYKILGTESNAGIEEVMKVKRIVAVLNVCRTRSSRSPASLA